MVPPQFFQAEDTVAIARALLGKLLITEIDGIPTGGLIAETEAYLGAQDRASHAYGNRRTPRTETLYRLGGITYIYLCYGLHHLLNFVTGPENVPHAVLIRSLHPTVGLDTMRKRRKNHLPLTTGPARVCQALGLTLAHNGLALPVQDVGVTPSHIAVSPRIGVDYAGPDALLPLRFNCNL